ncbi:MAG: hypothetical protein Q9182_006740 [Xanthomendoza sp. 2 TL-2023]
MRSISITLVLSAVLGLVTGGPIARRNSDPEIKIVNQKRRTVCLKVETGGGSFPTTATCGGLPGINVTARSTTLFHPSQGWHGALTPFTKTGALGTRLEFNYMPEQTWYNADMEHGMSGVTVGPSDGRLGPDGRPSLMGERDPLAKANAAWAREKDWGYKWLLWQSPPYIHVSEDKMRLTYVYMDRNASIWVREFFQLKAEFNAYVHPGTVMDPDNQKLQRIGVDLALQQAADDKARKVDGYAAMTIEIFDRG